MPHFSPSIAFAPTVATPLASRRGQSIRAASQLRPLALVASIALLMGGGIVIAVIATRGIDEHRPHPSASSSVSIKSGDEFEPAEIAVIRPKSDVELLSLLEADGWKQYQNPIHEEGGIVVVTVRKDKCLASVVLVEPSDEPHAKLYVENMNRHPSSHSESVYDGRWNMTIRADAFDPGGVPEDCVKDIHGHLLRDPIGH